MLRFILVVVGILGLAWSAPAPAPKAALSLVTELKTPASTAKLAPLVAPIPAPVIAPISRIAYAAPVLSQRRETTPPAPLLPPPPPPPPSSSSHGKPEVAPYAYAYSAPIAEIPSSYSIEQHGYHITY